MKKRIISLESWELLNKMGFVVPRLKGTIVHFPFKKIVYAYNEKGEKTKVKCTSTHPICITLQSP